MPNRNPTFRVLVVDDNPAIHQDFRKIFGANRTRSGASAAEATVFGDAGVIAEAPEFEIDSAFQGAQGAEMVREACEAGRPYALAFVDVRMPPGWDGVETTAAIWRHDADIQVVICTAYSDYTWSETLSKLGRSDRLVILKKPFDTIEVMQMASALGEKWRLARQTRAILEGLEQRVAERTLELAMAGDELRASEAQYRLLFDGNPHPMWVFDSESLRFVLVNAAAVAAYGYSEAEFLGMSIYGLRAPEDHASLTAELANARGKGKNFVQSRHRRKDGTSIDVEITADRMLFNGRPARLVLGHDVTQRKRAEIRVKRLNRVYAVLSGINTLIVRAIDRDELFREACRIAVEEGGFRMAWIGMVEGGHIRSIASAGDVGDFFGDVPTQLLDTQQEDAGIALRALRANQPMVSNDVQQDPRIIRKEKMKARGIASAVCLPLVVAGKPVGVLGFYAGEIGFFDDEEMRLLQELAGDVSFCMDHLGKQERLTYLASFDVLTGLANRSQFLGSLGQAMRIAAASGHKLAVYLVDIERFKNINDTLGQAAGDALLRQVAAWFTQAAGNEGLVARVGPDQFAVTLPQVRHEEDVARNLEKMLAEFLDHPFHLGDSAFRVAVKVGVALFPDDGVDAGILFRNAEAALKKTKARGDRYLFYTQKMTDLVAGRLSLENQLRQALEREEFVLHYQPKLDLASRALVGAEALIRWNDPQTGLVPPGRFIPVLEETGLIYDVGRWALRRAIRDYLAWLDAGLAAVRIAVNVSPLQLRHRGFVHEVGQVLAVDPRAVAGLELEITESVIMDDAELSIACLQQIRAMAVTIAVDDFGTGYSSLSYLAKLPVDTLKIDRSFVAESHSPGGRALLAAIVSLAHTLKLNVVAEGIETAEQSAALLQLGCNQAQGYFFGKPVAAEQFEAGFLRAGRARAVAVV